MKLPLKFTFRKMPSVREYDWCEKHGDLGDRFSTGGFSLAIGGVSFMKPICPRCYGEWLESMFPVERRTETTTETPA